MKKAKKDIDWGGPKVPVKFKIRQSVLKKLETLGFVEGVDENGNVILTDKGKRSIEDMIRQEYERSSVDR